MRPLCCILLCLAACAGEAPLQITPTTLDFGDVDFQPATPSEGYAAQTLSFENTTGRRLTVSFPDFPSDRLTLTALFSEPQPPTLSPLDPGESQAVVIGVSSYELGERDTLVQTRVLLRTSRGDQVVPVSYTPIRIIPEDTGL